MMAALSSPEIGTVTNQAMKIFLNKRQSTDFRERSQPTATTDPTCVHIIPEFIRCVPKVSPSSNTHARICSKHRHFIFITLQWVVLTGRPILDATTTVTAEASSMLNPLREKTMSVRVDFNANQDFSCRLHTLKV